MLALLEIPTSAYRWRAFGRNFNISIFKGLGRVSLGQDGAQHSIITSKVISVQAWQKSFAKLISRLQIKRYQKSMTATCSTFI